MHYCVTLCLLYYKSAIIKLSVNIFIIYNFFSTMLEATFVKEVTLAFIPLLCFPLQAKVSNNGQVGLGYSQNLRDGVKLSLSTLIEGKTLNQGGHKIGMALDFEA